VICTGSAASPRPSPPVLLLLIRLRRLVAIPEVTIGGVSSAVRFSGLGPGYAGVYRVDIDIPDAAWDGNLPLLLSTGGTVANLFHFP
jgi:uncharacterized protein (TIGR03437 family)